MNYKYLFILPFLFFVLSLSYGQEEERLTNGHAEYWNPTERELLDLFNGYIQERFVDHHKELLHTPLFIRFESADKKIEHLRKMGKDEAATKIEKRANERNNYLVNYVKENYTGSSFYFYYSKDSEAIFKERNFGLLYSDMDVKAAEVSVDKIAYVLTYRTLPRSNQGKAFSLHIWHDKAVHRIQYHNYSYFWSFKPNYEESLRFFCEKVKGN